MLTGILLATTLAFHPPSETDSLVIRPKASIFICPFDALDFTGGNGFRLGSEYKLTGPVNGMTEITLYSPSEREYMYVEGFRVRQDIRFYEAPWKWRFSGRQFFFFGCSVMYKDQTIGLKAGFTNPDSSEHFKTYGLHKTIIAPSLLIGRNECFGKKKRGYIEICAYLGVRRRDAYYFGLTASELQTMWPASVYPKQEESLAGDIATSNKSGYAPEFTATFRIGYLIGGGKLQVE